jgi:hypothetical protein
MPQMYGDEHMTGFNRICSLCADYQKCREYGIAAPNRLFCWITNDKIVLAEEKQ